MKNHFPRLIRAHDKPQNALYGGGFSVLFGSTSSGKVVNERSAMQITAVYACVCIFSEAILRSLAIELAQFNKSQYAGMGVR